MMVWDEIKERTMVMPITISHDLEAGGNIKILPASSNQEGLWILDQLKSEEGTINTLSATVQDASGKTGSASESVNLVRP